MGADMIITICRYPQHDDASMTSVTDVDWLRPLVWQRIEEISDEVIASLAEDVDGDGLCDEDAGPDEREDHAPHMRSVDEFRKHLLGIAMRLPFEYNREATDLHIGGRYFLATGGMDCQSDTYDEITLIDKSGVFDDLFPLRSS